VVISRKKAEIRQEQIRQSVVANARQELGKPYKYGATGPSAFDCSGLVFSVYRQVGLILPRSSRDQSKVGKSIPLTKASPGDLLFFSDKGKVNHVGIVVDNTKEGLLMIHASTSKGVVIESIHDSFYWAKRLRRVRTVIL
jgi:cell wall-associated NlpC family hydrolase